MTIQVVRKGRMSNKGFQIWTFFGVVLAALICSAVVGTQSVRAEGSCTAQQCTTARGFAVSTCGGQVQYFLCPLSGSDPNDFVFKCVRDQSPQVWECGGGPS
jgi:hypothetical protein